jgi:hypothetical protein
MKLYVFGGNTKTANLEVAKVEVDKETGRIKLSDSVTYDSESFEITYDNPYKFPMIAFK